MLNKTWGRNRIAIAVAIVLLSGAVVLFSYGADDSGPVVSNLTLSDWGIEKANDIALGQAAVVGDPPTLEIHALYPLSALGKTIEFESVVPPISAGRFSLSFTQTGDVNNLGGRFNVYQRPPSSARVLLEDDVLSLTYNKQAQGFCGLWLHLFDSSKPDPKRLYMDARPFQTLTFAIRGQRGGESCVLRVADRNWLLKEDTMPVGEIALFLPAGRIGQEWTRVEVPLDRFPPAIDRTCLASLAFAVEKTQESRIDIKDVAFWASQPSPQKDQPISGKANEKRLQQRATWVWNTPDLIADANERIALSNFLSERKINNLFLQLPAVFYKSDFKQKFQDSLAGLRNLIAVLKEENITVFALDGGRDYGQPKNHASVLSTLSNVIEYNRRVPQNERFSGVHYDVEPHALPGFGSVRRPEFFTNLLALYAKMAELLKNNDLELGVDIPFWYDSPDELTEVNNTAVFNKVRKNVSQHILDLVDYAVVMDYRTKAEGPDGIVLNVTDELEYATSLSKSIFVAVETKPIPDQTLYRFRGTALNRVPNPFPDNGLLVIRPKADTFEIALYPTSQFITGGDIGFCWPIASKVTVPGSRISFASFDNFYLEKVLNESVPVLTKQPSFKGFAIHDYVNYKRLVSAQK